MICATNMQKLNWNPANLKSSNDNSLKTVMFDISLFVQDSLKSWMKHVLTEEPPLCV